MARRSTLFNALLLCSALAPMAEAQTWTGITNTRTASSSVAMLLTDGSILVHSVNSANWARFKPDANGNYINGTWSSVASMVSTYKPTYYASAVLPDGRVVVVGGEYINNSAVWSATGAIYDPLGNTWATLSNPLGWTSMGDAQCVVLNDGRFMVARPQNTASAILDPNTLTWSAAGTGKLDRHDEESWCLLKDGSVLTVDVLNAPHAEKFVPSTNAWISAGDLPYIIPHAATQEIGPLLMMTDGRVLATGGNGKNAIYTPATSLLGTGSWAPLPDFPIFSTVQFGMPDAPACLLPNGKALLCTSGIPNSGWPNGCRFFEFDGGTFTQVASTPRAGVNPCYTGVMLMLPTGQVFFTDQSSNVVIYTPVGGPQESWRPKITTAPTTVIPGQSFLLGGMQFNGLSECSTYGDDASNSCNYPVVRLKNVSTGHVFYCRTANHSTMGVATGTLQVTTNVTAPANVEIGPATMEVVVNGIASTSVPITVKPLQYRIRELGPAGSLTDTITTGVNAGSESVGAGGTGFGTPAEAMSSHAWVAGGVQNLGVPAGFTNSRLSAINLQGHAVGNASTATDKKPIFQNSGVTSLLPSVGLPAALTEALAINDRDEIVGNSVYSGISHALYWASPSGTPVVMQTLAGFPHAGVKSIANNGMIVGWVQSADLATVQGVYWPRANVAPIQMGTVGTLNVQTVNSINSTLGAVGALRAPGGLDAAAVWHSNIGTMLPNLANTTTSIATDINAGSAIAGSYLLTGDPTDHPRACIWREGSVLDLTSLIDTSDAPSLNWQLSWPSDYADNGAITGWGFKGGVRKSFLAIPATDGAPAGNVDCNVLFGDFVGTKPPLTFEFVRAGTGFSDGSETVSPTIGSGVYNLNAGSRRGLYSLRVHSTNWLIRQINNVVISDLGGQAFFELINGDVDQSGEVDAVDIDAVIAMFGSTAAVAADVDGSLEVDAVDIDIVISHFGAVGD